MTTTTEPVVTPTATVEYSGQLYLGARAAVIPLWESLEQPELKDELLHRLALKLDRWSEHASLLWQTISQAGEKPDKLVLIATVLAFGTLLPEQVDHDLMGTSLTQAQYQQLYSELEPGFTPILGCYQAGMSVMVVSQAVEAFVMNQTKAPAKLAAFTMVISSSLMPFCTPVVCERPDHYTDEERAALNHVSPIIQEAITLVRNSRLSTADCRQAWDALVEAAHLSPIERLMFEAELMRFLSNMAMAIPAPWFKRDMGESADATPQGDHRSGCE